MEYRSRKGGIGKRLGKCHSISKFMISLIVLITFSILPTAGYSQEKILKVGVIMGAPYSLRVEGKLRGIAVEFWEKVAANAKLKYQYATFSENVDEGLLAVKNGTIDILIGPIANSYERLQLVDLSQPFYSDKFIFIVKKHRASFGDIFQSLVKKVYLPLILLGVSFFIIYIHVIWYFERGNISMPDKYFAAIGYTAWMHLLGRYLNLETPSTFVGRIAAMFWLALAAVIASSLIAVITSALTLSYSPDHGVSIKSFSDLGDKIIAAEIGKKSKEVAEERGLTILKVETFVEGVDAVINNKADAFITRESFARYYLKEKHITDLVPTSYAISNTVSAFAVPINSPLRRIVSLGITYLQTNNLTRNICQKYMGNLSINCDL